MKRLSCLAGILLALSCAHIVCGSTATTLVSTDRRENQDLDGDWKIIVDPYLSGLYNSHRQLKPNGIFKDVVVPRGSSDLVEYGFAGAPSIKVPGDWNMQVEALRYYEGPVWYERTFNHDPQPGKRAFFHVGAANYRATLWINGEEICSHEGGFTPFDCEITQQLHRGGNDAVLLVDNTRLADGVPTLNTDWYNYGGLTRDVSVISVSASFIDTYDLHLDRKDRNTIEGYVHVDGSTPGAVVTVEIPSLHAQTSSKTDDGGNAAVLLKANNLELWSPETPRLYDVKVGVGEDSLTDQIGFRTIEVDGSRILLNGKPIFLNGIDVHAEAPYRSGRVSNQSDVDTLFGWIKDLGCNYVRLTHYPHDARMTRTADRLGILVWSEIPTYWALEFGNPAVYAKAKTQLEENIRRDRNRASIILWSIANETPNSPARTDFLTRLAQRTRELDPTRLVTAALLVRSEGHTKIVDDPLGVALDVIGANEYIGWYEGRPSDADTTEWRFKYDKPVIMSEFGGEALAGYEGDKTQRWTEAYQADI
jgi:beta-glucuronidase